MSTSEKLIRAATVTVLAALALAAVLLLGSLLAAVVVTALYAPT